MNPINTNTVGIRTQTQDVAQSSQADSTNDAGEAQKKGKILSGAQSQQVSSSASFSKQDASDVARSGGAGRLRTSKRSKDKDAKNILKSMSKNKQEAADSVLAELKEALSNGEEEFTNTGGGAKQMDDLVQEFLLGSDFDIAEQVSLLEVVKEGISSDGIKEALENKIEELLDSSLTAKISLATSNLLRGIDRTAFVTGTSLREDINTMLSYDNQGEFLTALENKYGTEKMTNEFPAICSQLHSIFSVAMSSLSSCSIPEKGQLFSALTKVSSLQQISHIYGKAAELVASATKRHSV
ncbi:MAG: hypothetical protein ACRCV3_00335 [Desulfovibrionaceae bacterium]